MQHFKTSVITLMVLAFLLSGCLSSLGRIGRSADPDSPPLASDLVDNAAKADNADDAVPDNPPAERNQDSDSESVPEASQSGTITIATAVGEEIAVTIAGALLTKLGEALFTQNEDIERIQNTHNERLLIIITDDKIAYFGLTTSTAYEIDFKNSDGYEVVDIVRTTDGDITVYLKGTANAQ